MAFTLWSQDIFSKGELSPFMYGRASVNEYYNGLKTAQNVLTFPTGAAGKRFGTLYQSTLAGFTSYTQLYFQTFQYLNECVYQVVIIPGSIFIYLEGLLVASVANSLTQSQVYNASTTVIGAFFRVSGQGFKPYDLKRSLTVSHTIASFTSTTFTASAAIWSGAGIVLPITLSVVGGTGLQTTPPISPGVTYFAATTSTTSGIIFATPEDAKDYLVTGNLTNAFVISSLGTGTTTVNVFNTFTFTNTVFRDLPFYDFNNSVVSYDALTFTPAATTGPDVSITVSGAGYAPLDSSYVGGAFIGGGGTARITLVMSATSFKVAIQTPFAGTTAILGSLALLAEPAWSDVRGWPQVCSSYQNRALFANTSSLPNGFWASVINDYTDFGDLTTDDDDAISWYPTSDNMNFIKFIVPYRSITVHTNTGIYSSPLSDVAAITPSNFTLQLQDSTPADVLQPQAIDNQILVLSGNDAHQMIWDGINNAYTSSIVSIINEQVIRNPLDETAFQNLRRAGSRFVFIINENGSMAAFQTLISQGVAGFTPQIMEQSYGNASFRQVASSSNGRCWFVVERQTAAAGSPVAITGFSLKTPTAASTLKAVATNFSTTVPTAIKFTTSGTLPVSSPQVLTTQYYWAIGTTADDFEVYLKQEDALDSVDAIEFTSAGTTSNVVAWNLSTIFTLEELTDSVFLDCAVQYHGAPASTITTGVLFNAQDVKMIGDGFGFESAAEDNVGNQIVFEAHGALTPVSNAYIGFPINTIMEPMALSISTGQSIKTTSLTKPTHVRWVRFMFNNTIGGTINGVPIALLPFDMANIGNPPEPARGVFEMSIMKGWDDFNNPTYTIEHSEPFNIQLLGAFYSVDN
jgi:hypothetical protein